MDGLHTARCKASEIDGAPGGVKSVEHCCAFLAGVGQTVVGGTDANVAVGGGGVHVFVGDEVYGASAVDGCG